MKTRLVLFLIHIYLAFAHALMPKEGQQFFKDFYAGEHKRKKREWADKVFGTNVREKS